MDKKNSDVSEIDKAIAKAQEKKAKRQALNGEAVTKPVKLKAAAPPKAPKATDEEKLAKRAARKVEADAKAAVRAEARAERKAARALAKATPHMKKIERAASRLPALTDEARLVFNDVTVNFAAADVASIAAHLQHFNRVSATGRAVGATAPSVGASVTIVGGDPRYVGKTGVVTKAQRIRCYVEVEGAKKALYLFISDVQVAQSEVATGTNG